MSTTARTIAHQCAVEQLQLAVHWALLHPCPRRVPAPAGRTTTASSPLVHPWPVPVHRWSRSSHPPPSPPPWASPWTPAKQLLADALELTYRLPRLLDLVERGAVPVWRARAISRETHDLSLEAVAYRGPAHLRHTLEDRPGRRRPAGPGSPALLRPRPRHRRRRTRTHPTRRLATAPRQPRHHRPRDDPGHPRRPALRPDRHPHRRRTQRTSVTPTRSTSGGPGRSGSSPTPSTPWTSCPAASAAPTRRVLVR